MIDSMLSCKLTPSSPFNKACPVDRAERECSLDDIISTASHTKTVLETIEKESNRSHGVGSDELR